MMLAFILVLGMAAYTQPVKAQAGITSTATPAVEENPPDAPDRVDVSPTATDSAIQARLQNILDATGWFVRPIVKVQDGVVFLKGQATTKEQKTWATNLATKTQDVAAVVNQIEIIETSIWDFTPAFAGITTLWRSVVRSIPLIGFSLIILVLAWLVARLSMNLSRASLKRRLSNPFLANIAGYTVGVVVFLLGLYVVFQVAGLTNIALTVLGGTGLLGIVLGIAFREITENFLASVFLSLQFPFQKGDFVEIAGVTGFIQALTTRATILMTPEGNHVQIPNATVYKSNIKNFTSNPNIRGDFIIGIGYDDPISDVQEVALQVLREHPAILNDPEPWVLVDSLGSATVNLKIYFWIDARTHSLLKVKSSVIRRVKQTFQTAGISMPDEAREVIFPSGVSVHLSDQPIKKLPESETSAQAVKPADAIPVATDAEGDLTSEAEDIQDQSRKSRTPEEGENLLKDAK